MKNMILVIIPPSIAIKVSRKYTNLRRKMRRSTGRAYSIVKLRQKERMSLGKVLCLSAHLMRRTTDLLLGEDCKLRFAK